MEDYNKYRNNHTHKRKSPRGSKIGFYISLAICVTAIGLAVWSTYTSYSQYKGEKDQLSTTVNATQANNAMTGVTVENTTTLFATEEETTVSATEQTTESTTISETTNPKTSTTMSAVQTMLQVTGSLIYPVEDAQVTKAFSEEAVYSKTMGDYRSHLGLDFACKKSDSVLAMADGVIADAYSDERMGKVVIMDCGSFMIYYSGIDKLKVNINDTVKKGDVLSNVGEIPSEKKDGVHLHVSVRVNGSYVDPLSVISNNQ